MGYQNSKQSGGSRLSTIRDVARECGVSIATVSRAFTEGSPVSAQTREKVLAAAKRLCYTPDMMARGLRGAGTGTVGIIIPSIDNYFYLGLLRHVEAALRADGLRLLVCFMQYNVTSERDALETMAASRVDSLIFTPRSFDNRDLTDELRRRMHLIQLFSDVYGELDSLTVDDARGTRDATRYLLGRGCRRILYVGGDPRISGYREALEESGISADPAGILYGWETTEADVAAAVKNFSADAVLAVARQAETAWLAITGAGYKVPDQLSFIAYDDVNWLKLFGITAVAHPMHELTAALQTILRRGAGGAPVKLKVTPYLEERSSVRKPDPK